MVVCINYRHFSLQSRKMPLLNIWHRTLRKTFWFVLFTSWANYALVTCTQTMQNDECLWSSSHDWRGVSTANQSIERERVELVWAMKSSVWNALSQHGWGSPCALWVQSLGESSELDIWIWVRGNKAEFKMSEEDFYFQVICSKL